MMEGTGLFCPAPAAWSKLQFPNAGGITFALIKEIVEPLTVRTAIHYLTKNPPEGGLLLNGGVFGLICTTNLKIASI